MFLWFPKGSEGSLFIWVQSGLNGHGEAPRKTLAPPGVFLALPEGEIQGVLQNFAALDTPTVSTLC